MVELVLFLVLLIVSKKHIREIEMLFMAHQEFAEYIIFSDFREGVSYYMADANCLKNRISFSKKCRISLIP
jgi:hypothetical protein